MLQNVFARLACCRTTAYVRFSVSLTSRDAPERVWALGMLQNDSVCKVCRHRLHFVMLQNVFARLAMLHHDSIRNVLEISLQLAMLQNDSVRKVCDFVGW